jgi:hypothetical protein
MDILLLNMFYVQVIMKTPEVQSFYQIYLASHLKQNCQKSPKKFPYA